VTASRFLVALRFTLLLGGLGAGVLLGFRARPSTPKPVVELTLPDGRPLGGRLRLASEHLPTLRAELPWSNDASLYGWGSVRVVGRPRIDDLRVRVIIDAPTAARRWGSVCALHLEGEAGSVERSAAYVGQPMDGGAMYDAIRVEMTIEEVRRLAAASHIEGSVCGDRLTLGPEPLATLRAFVAQFDELATRTRRARATEVLTAPEDPDIEEIPVLEDAG